MKDLCSAIIDIFGEEYLRTLTKEDIMRMLEENAMRGFPRMLGSLDCMHWKWENCPTAWHGTHVNGKIGSPTLILEAVETLNEKQKNFSKAQEAVRKDVQRAFKVLQASFAIVKGLAIYWDQGEYDHIMKNCIKLHNMIVESEEDPEEWQPPEGETLEFVVHNQDENFIQSNHINRIKSMVSTVTRSQLKLDQREHLWNRSGEGGLILQL
ncbi:hypothetical protein Ddye_006141 [Dipteronia dyeriana]|uniref:Uncharacterized protein n=1 Tax=Dipteronia dyeriana TaxID=168575 RepID=A0AAE0CQW7_9ROSI|nr:hypothetical protein Ddye_006141 [Dipteronia dyeriana]